ncbi:MAG: hydantoinase/oxoprolinase family protein [Gammaproteobacteria bacterium]|nr:hydantoinase/oxoprolinase family protein [Gammaproteobacteria bacterium]
MDHARKPVRVGADIGGTFTDIQTFDTRTGRVSAYKLPTPPDDPSIALVEGIKAAGALHGFTLADVGYLLHGTTIATNAVLERKLPRAALVTTAGFEDVLEIGRHNRRDVYSVWPRPVPALVPRERRFGLAERMTARGGADVSPTSEALAAIVEQIRYADVAAVAISFLHAYANPAHEQAMARAIAAALPDLCVSCSSEVSPEIREYERTSTTVLNALLQPVVTRYIDMLRERLEAENFAPQLLLVQSNGSVCSPATAAREPVRLLLSGPSGGAMAALGLSRALHLPNVVGVDMGGTSYDVSLVRNDRIEVVTQAEIDRLPVRVPMVEIRTIGAGGGSIARVLRGRQIKVGPESAGARPGPVCYGRGGTEPTVTDANLALGRLDAGYFLGGAMALDLPAARHAIATRIAAPLELSHDAAAAGILRITNTNLAAAIRVTLFEKGLDPRDFALLSFGGAGSVHACAVAEELGMRRIVFPVGASTLSARGILDADIAHAFARSGVRAFEQTALSAITRIVDELRTEAGKRLDADGIPAADQDMRLAVDLRYKGQAFEMTVPWVASAIDADSLAATAQAFHDEHERRYSYANRADLVELVTVRLNAIGRLARVEARADVAAAQGGATGTRDVYGRDGWEAIPVWRRDNLGETAAVTGPAIIEEAYTTIFLASGWRLTRGPDGHLFADAIEGTS